MDHSKACYDERGRQKTLSRRGLSRASVHPRVIDGLVLSGRDTEGTLWSLAIDPKSANMGYTGTGYIGVSSDFWGGSRAPAGCHVWPGRAGRQRVPVELGMMLRTVSHAAPFGA